MRDSPSMKHIKFLPLQQLIQPILIMLFKKDYQINIIVLIQKELRTLYVTAIEAIVDRIRL